MQNKSELQKFKNAYLPRFPNLKSSLNAKLRFPIRIISPLNEEYSIKFLKETDILLKEIAL